MCFIVFNETVWFLHLFSLCSNQLVMGQQGCMAEEGGGGVRQGGLIIEQGMSGLDWTGERLMEVSLRLGCWDGIITQHKTFRNISCCF